MKRMLGTITLAIIGLVALCATVMACIDCPGDATPTAVKAGQTVTFTGPAYDPTKFDFQWSVGDSGGPIDVYLDGALAPSGGKTFIFDVPPACEKKRYGVYLTVTSKDLASCKDEKCQAILADPLCSCPKVSDICCDPDHPNTYVVYGTVGASATEESVGTRCPTNGLILKWILDGKEVGSGTVYVIDCTKLTDGSHTLVLEIWRKTPAGPVKVECFKCSNTFNKISKPVAAITPPSG